MNQEKEKIEKPLTNILQKLLFAILIFITGYWSTQAVWKYLRCEIEVFVSCLSVKTRELSFTQFHCDKKKTQIRTISME